MSTDNNRLNPPAPTPQPKQPWQGLLVERHAEFAERTRALVVRHIKLALTASKVRDQLGSYEALDKWCQQVGLDTGDVEGHAEFGEAMWKSNKLYKRMLGCEDYSIFELLYDDWCTSFVRPNDPAKMAYLEKMIELHERKQAREGGPSHA